MPFLTTGTYGSVGDDDGGRVDIRGQILQDLRQSQSHHTGYQFQRQCHTFGFSDGNESRGSTVNRNWPFRLSNLRRIGRGEAMMGGEEKISEESAGYGESWNHEQ